MKPQYLPEKNSSYDPTPIDVQELREILHQAGKKLAEESADYNITVFEPEIESYDQIRGI